MIIGKGPLPFQPELMGDSLFLGERGLYMVGKCVIFADLEPAVQDPPELLKAPFSAGLIEDEAVIGVELVAYFVHENNLCRF